MKLSYDYSEMIEELEEEIEYGAITPDSKIQVLRSEEELFNEHSSGYLPIIDWYYGSDDMVKNVLTPCHEDTEEDKAAIKQAWADYGRDKAKLVTVKVADVLAEMKEWDKIL